MAKRVGPPVRTAKAPAAPKTSKPSKPKAANGSATHVSRRVQIVDHCLAAKAIATELGEDFLAYMLAMAIQEAQSKL